MARIEVKHLFLEPLTLKLVLDFYNVSENFHGPHYTSAASTDREPESFAPQITAVITPHERALTRGVFSVKSRDCEKRSSNER